jgi:hypothetical protein
MHQKTLLSYSVQHRSISQGRIRKAKPELETILSRLVDTHARLQILAHQNHQTSDIGVPMSHTQNGIVPLLCNVEQESEVIVIPLFTSRKTISLSPGNNEVIYVML